MSDARAFNQKALSNPNIIDLADAMGLGEFQSLGFRTMNGEDWLDYAFERGTIALFSSSTIARYDNILHIAIQAPSIQEVLATAKALNIAQHVQHVQ